MYLEEIKTVLKTVAFGLDVIVQIIFLPIILLLIILAIPINDISYWVKRKKKARPKIVYGFSPNLNWYYLTKADEKHGYVSAVVVRNIDRLSRGLAYTYNFEKMFRIPFLRGLEGYLAFILVLYKFDIFICNFGDSFLT